MRYFFKTLALRYLFAAIALLLASGSGHAQKRIALVIGNSAYEHVSPLKNPRNDAELIARSLTVAGFDVVKVLDADTKALKTALLNFGRSLREGPEAGLFYYAGHGIQVNGRNYLIPINARIENEDEVDLEGIDVNSFLRVMRSSKSAVNIVVLDACRNNPFARSFRSSTPAGGLAPVDAPKGTFIAYATSPGDVALDGDGKNSPYSTALAKAIGIKGISIETAFKTARRSVLKATDSRQVPWETSSLVGEFSFFPGKKSAEPNAIAIPAPQIAIEPKQVDVARVMKKASVALGSKNYELALELYREAAKEGNAKALNNIGAFYGNGWAVPKDKTRAVEYYRKAVAKKYTSAYFNLGRAFLTGKGVEKNSEEAVRLLTLAADQGHVKAMSTLANVYRKGKDVTRDYDIAAKLFARAAEKDNLDAIYFLGYMYHEGQGVERDFVKSASLFKRAAARKNSNSAYYLATMYDVGQGVIKDPEAAAELIYTSLKRGQKKILNIMIKSGKTWSRKFRKSIQRKLKGDGYYFGLVTGVFGPSTIKALKLAAR